MLQSQKLKGAILEKKLTYEKCAKHLDISITAFCNKVNGRTEFTCVEVSRLSNLLKLSDNDKINIFLN